MEHNSAVTKKSKGKAKQTAEHKQNRGGSAGDREREPANAAKMVNLFKRYFPHTAVVSYTNREPYQAFRVICAQGVYVFPIFRFNEDSKDGGVQFPFNPSVITTTDASKLRFVTRTFPQLSLQEEKVAPVSVPVMHCESRPKGNLVMLKMHVSELTKNLLGKNTRRWFTILEVAMEQSPGVWIALPQTTFAVGSLSSQPKSDETPANWLLTPAFPDRRLADRQQFQMAVLRRLGRYQWIDQDWIDVNIPDEQFGNKWKARSVNPTAMDPLQAASVGPAFPNLPVQPVMGPAFPNLPVQSVMNVAFPMANYAPLEPTVHPQLQSYPQLPSYPPMNPSPVPAQSPILEHKGPTSPLANVPPAAPLPAQGPLIPVELTPFNYAEWAESKLNLALQFKEQRKNDLALASLWEVACRDQFPICPAHVRCVAHYCELARKDLEALKTATGNLFRRLNVPLFFPFDCDPSFSYVTRTDRLCLPAIVSGDYAADFSAFDEQLLLSLAIALNKIGECFKMRKNFRWGENTYANSRRVFLYLAVTYHPNNPHPYPEHQGSLANNRCLLHRAKGEYELGATYGRESQYLWRIAVAADPTNRHKNLALSNAIHNTGMCELEIARTRADYEMAKGMFYEAYNLRHSWRAAEDLIASSLSTAAVCLTKQLPTAQQLKDVQDEAVLRRVKAQIDLALVYFKQGIELFQKAKMDQALAQVYHRRSELYQRIENMEAELVDLLAENEIRKRIHADQPDHIDLVVNYCCLIELAARQCNIPQARRLFAEARINETVLSSPSALETNANQKADVLRSLVKYFYISALLLDETQQASIDTARALLFQARPRCHSHEAQQEFNEIERTLTDPDELLSKALAFRASSTNFAISAAPASPTLPAQVDTLGQYQGICMQPIGALPPTDPQSPFGLLPPISPVVDFPEVSDQPDEGHDSDSESSAGDE